MFTAGRCWWASCSLLQSSSFECRNSQVILNNRTTELQSIFSIYKYLLLCILSSSLFYLMSRHFKQRDRHSLWTRCRYSPKEYTYHMHIHFLQLVTVSQTSLNIGHTSLNSIYKLLLCQFRDSQCNSSWIYANLWVSLCIWLAFGWNCQF